MNKYIFLLVFFSFTLNASGLKIIYEKGTVTVTRSNKIIKTKEIFPADKITTGANSLAILKGERETLKVQADSEIVYQHGANIEESTFLLNLGGLVSKINKKKFQVKIKAVSMGVRGTQFFSSVDHDNKILMCVNEGEVEVDDGHHKTMVPAGQGVSVINGETSKPMNLAWTRNVNWEMDPNKVTEEKKIYLEQTPEKKTIINSSPESTHEEKSIYDD